LTVEESPEYNNTLSVHGGDPNSQLTQIFQQLSQLSQQPNASWNEEIQKPKVEEVVEKKVEVKNQSVEALFQAPVEQPAKKEEENIFADLKEVQNLSPQEVRAARILELFPDADLHALIENIRRYPYKTDDEIIDFVIFSNF